MIYHYFFFNRGSNRNNLYGMFAMTILCLNLSDVAISLLNILIIVVLFITASKKK